MFSIAPSQSHEMSLDELLKRLMQQEIVEGIIISGSYAREALKVESDYDIVVILKEIPLPMQVLLTTVEGRMTDVVFWTSQAILEMLNQEEIALNSAEGAVLSWLKTGKILYDATGNLEKLCQANPKQSIVSTERDKYNLWFRVNFNLYHGQRLLKSNDEVYRLALDMRFLYMLDEVLQAYMLFRNIPQRGEKATVRHLQSHAPEDLTLYIKALQSPSQTEKFQHYHDFAALALAPVGGLWGSNAIVGFNLAEGLEPQQIKELYLFWNNLIS